MPGRGMLANLFAIRGGTSYETTIATTGVKGEAAIDRGKFLDTGARLIPLSEIEKPLPVRRGRWDPVSGTVVYDDGATEQSAAIGGAVPTYKPRPAKTSEPKAEKPRREPTQAEPEPKRPCRLDIKSDPRRERVLELRRLGMALRQIGHLVHMDGANVKAICQDAGLPEHYRNKQKPTPEPIPAAPIEPEPTPVVTPEPEPATPDPAPPSSGKRPWAGLSQKERRERIITMRAAGMSKDDIAGALHMRQDTVRKICEEEGFARVLPDWGHWCRGAKHPMAKLTDDDVRAIRKATEPYPVVAKRFGTVPSTVCRIKKRTIWTHVPDEPDDAAAD